MVSQEYQCWLVEGNIIDQILELIESFSKIQFIYSPTKCNKVAYRLASQASSFIDKQVWLSECFLWLSNLLYRDSFNYMHL